LHNYTHTHTHTHTHTITVSHFCEHKRLHLESSKQNYYIISLRAIIKAIFTHTHTHTHTRTRTHTHNVCVCLSTCLSVCLCLCALLTSASSNQPHFLIILFPDHSQFFGRQSNQKNGFFSGQRQVFFFPGQRHGQYISAHRI